MVCVYTTWPHQVMNMNLTYLTYSGKNKSWCSIVWEYSPQFLPMSAGNAGLPIYRRCLRLSKPTWDLTSTLKKSFLMGNFKYRQTLRKQYCGFPWCQCLPATVVDIPQLIFLYPGPFQGPRLYLLLRSVLKQIPVLCPSLTLQSLKVILDPRRDLLCLRRSCPSVK